MEESSLPDRRRHGYKELETKLNKHVDEMGEQLTAHVEKMAKHLDAHAKTLDTRFARFVRSALFAFAIIGLLSAASLVGFGLLLRAQGEQADDIQNQRQETILRNCSEQNTRHDDTIKKFHALANQAIKKHPEQSSQINEAIDGNLKLINALVPKRNCAKLVALAVDPETG